MRIATPPVPAERLVELPATAAAAGVARRELLRLAAQSATPPSTVGDRTAGAEPVSVPARAAISTPR